MEFAMPENFVFACTNKSATAAKRHGRGAPDFTADGQTFVFQDSLSGFLKIY